MSLNSTYGCWQTLALEKDADIKSIKRAYHRLLRLYKPDEFPDDFKVLYSAYEEAIAYAKQRDCEETLDRQDVLCVHDEEQVLDYDNKFIEEEENLSILREKIKKLTYDNEDIDEFNTLSNWTFILENELDVSISSIKEISEYIIYALENFARKNPNVKLNNEVFGALNKIFHWDRRRYTSKGISLTYAYISLFQDDSSGFISRATYQRLFIGAIDICLFMLLELIRCYVFWGTFDIAYAGFSYMLYITIFMILTNGRTLGQIILGYRLYLNDTFERAPLWRAYLHGAAAAIYAPAMLFVILLKLDIAQLGLDIQNVVFWGYLFVMTYFAYRKEKLYLPQDVFGLYLGKPIYTGWLK